MTTLDRNGNRRRGAMGASLLLAIVCAAPGFGQALDDGRKAGLSEAQKLALDDLERDDPALSVSWDARVAIPRSMTGRLTAPSGAPPEVVALDFVRARRDLFRIADVSSELGAPAVERDALQMAHVRFAQRHRGVPVLGSELRVHVDAAGVVTAVEAELLPGLALPSEPLVSSADAVSAAVKDLGDAAARAAPALVVFDPGRLTQGRRDDRLAWRISLSSGKRGEWVYFVDALSGEIAFKYDNTHHARDREIRGYIATGCNLGPIIYNEAGPVVPNPGQDATNAYNFSGDTYNYYLGTHGRDSYDGAGARMVAVVGEPVANAQWSPGCQRTMFGVGYATKDVVAHEWQHAVTEHTANLIYSCQSGAMNESMSDVFGAMIDRDDWLMGEDLPGGYIRSLADPRASRPPQPDTNTGASPCAGVHTNSGIPNKVAYLVSDGGVHYGVTVAGLGKGALEAIWFRALRFHMGPSTDFAGARDASIAAATALYGSGSAAVCSVTNAWASVAVGPVCAPPVDNAAFVSQSVPTTMVAGEYYNVSVTMRNTGTSTWTRVNQYKLGSQNPQDNVRWGLGRVQLPTAVSVAPGASYTFQFTVRAPANAGTHNFQWRMLRENIAWFGAFTPNVAVNVQPPPPTTPPPPSGLSAFYNPTTRLIFLNWVDNSNNETGFHLQFSYSGSAWSDLSPPTVGANVTSRSIGPNPPTGSYQFRVRAFAGTLYSAFSNVASVIVTNPPTASIAWIQPAEFSWGPPGTLTAAGYASNGMGGVQLVWRERGDNGVWGPWVTVAWQPPPDANGTWSNTISSGNPTNRCHWFDAYVNYSGVTSPVFHYTGWPGCP